MDDVRGKQWILDQIKKKYRKAKTPSDQPDGFNLDGLISHAVRARRSLCISFELRTKNGKKLPVGDLSTEQAKKLPPGEDKIRRFVKDLKKDGKIKFYESPLKKGKKGRGGAGNKRIIGPITLGEKIGTRRGGHLHTFFNLLERLDKLRGMDVSKFGTKELCSYAIMKNEIFRFPVSYAQTAKNSVWIKELFEYVCNEITDTCDALEERISKNRKVHDAYKSFDKLLSSEEFFLEGIALIHPSRHVLDVAKHVNVIRDLKE